MRDREEPLYRKVNTRARGVRHRFGGDFRHSRNAKDAGRDSMHGGTRRGLDYTPLFRFLLSKVGQPWDAVFGEAVSRLDRKEPIFWMVAPDRVSGKAYVRLGESTYFSGLYVDGDGLLQKVAPEIGPHSLEPSCPCCTHTFNGKPFSKKYRTP